MTWNNNSGVLNLQLSGSSNCSGLQIIPILCLNDCPDPNRECNVNSNQLYWSDATLWPGGVLPKQGDNVVIPCPWNMIIDVNNTPILNSLTIDGILKFSENQTST